MRERVDCSMGMPVARDWFGATEKAKKGPSEGKRGDRTSGSEPAWPMSGKQTGQACGVSG